MNKKRKVEKKEYEYEEAPSGFIWLINAKEPLMKFEGGFGFDGVLAFDGDDEKVQCHFCGGWFGALGRHLAKEHNMKASEYKEKTGLPSTMALISEKHREALVKSGLDKRLQNLRIQGKKTAQQRAKISASLKQHRMYNKNRTNTCPEQLIARLQARAKELGRTPSTRELPFYEALLKTYGSYPEACRFAGLTPRANGEWVTKSKTGPRKYTENDVVDFINNFYLKNNKLPTPTDWEKAGKRDLYDMIKRHKWDKTALYKRAVFQSGKYVKIQIPQASVVNFTQDELLEFLKKFEDHHGRKPSYSDAKRGLLPHLSRYSYHFGSWKNALRLAGVSV